MNVIEYSDREIAPGFAILHTMHGITETLYVYDVVFRLDRGLQLHTRHADNTLGPIIFPHPDEKIRVLSAPTQEEDSWSVPTTDYPHARIMR